MDLVSRVREYCLRWRMFSPGDRVLVGVSGGPDSVCLLDLLYRLRNELDIEIWVAHLNHLLRGQEAAADAAYVARLAGGCGLPLVSEEYDVRGRQDETGDSLQVAARDVRYQFYERVAEEIGAVRVALGHHADDQAETILINFLRGSGIAGLAGMPPVRGPYVRPLLAERRRAIEAYCQERNLAPRTDASNLKPVYTRNRLRLELIPLLERDYNPGLVPTLLRMSEALRQEDALLADAAEHVLPGVMRTGEEEEGGVVILVRPALLNLQPALQRRVVRRAWQAMTGETGLSFAHVERILDLARSPRGGGRLILPGSVRVERSADRLVMRRREKPAPGPFIYRLAVPGETFIRECGATIKAVTPGDAAGLPDPRCIAPWGTVLDLDCLQPPLTVRSRKPGDLFRPSGGGTVKLKKFFIDAKVPREQRATVPLVVDGAGRIAWVPGLRTAAFCLLTPGTRRPLILELEQIGREELRGFGSN